MDGSLAASCASLPLNFVDAVLLKARRKDKAKKKLVGHVRESLQKDRSYMPLPTRQLGLLYWTKISDPSEGGDRTKFLSTTTSCVLNVVLEHRTTSSSPSPERPTNSPYQMFRSSASRTDSQDIEPHCEEGDMFSKQYTRQLSIDSPPSYHSILTSTTLESPICSPQPLPLMNVAEWEILEPAPNMWSCDDSIEIGYPASDSLALPEPPLYQTLPAAKDFDNQIMVETTETGSLYTLSNTASSNIPSRIFRVPLSVLSVGAPYTDQQLEIPQGMLSENMMSEAMLDVRGVPMNSGDINGNFRTYESCSSPFLQSSQNVSVDIKEPGRIKGVPHVDDSAETTRQYKCRNCTRSFVKRRWLERHEVIHLKPHLCNICGMRFGRNDQRKQHYLTHVAGLSKKS
ncbi:hypothetical protein K469DRAFT_693882 [Zopfia rhizophila CBS 207.26]|uniref:C2H2-type domain-containing protein n=1 Tax=Zopfia rhizophila CBS 207.26 TaxID=1314779 RepID=A0A6A6DJF0_9PEZI|nr:hypothetical protein K469DRAFT_693882 [Zopfia rhizophila CBS 207.26]